MPPRDALLIEGIGKPKSSGKMKAAEDTGDHMDEDVDGFAEDAYAALKADDAEGFKLALKGMVEACMPEY